MKFPQGMRPKCAVRMLAGWLALSVLGEAASSIALEHVAGGLTAPLSVVPLPTGGKLVVEQSGFLRLLDDRGQLRAEPLLNWTNRMAALKLGGFDERGLLDVALHPKFAENRRVFIAYSAPLREGGPVGFDSTLRISELQLPDTEPLRVDPATERVLLAVDKPFFNHNGGRLAFGPDGFLYISIGDGGAGNDQGRRPPTGNGQNLDTLLGKIIRIDVNAADGRGIPKDNPFADGKEGRPEIYAYGLRNVWGLSFDRGGAHELFAADVGQNLFEELNIIQRGANYGWFLREGFHGFNPSKASEPADPGPRTGPRGEPLVDPILEYRHPRPKLTEGEISGLSVTGGYVYRGTQIPVLQGQYVFADWSRNWALPQGQLLVARRPSGDSTGARWTLEPLTVATPEKWKGYVTGMGEDADGELYVLTSETATLMAGKGHVWKLVPAP